MEATKKHPTEKRIELKVFGPASKKGEALKALSEVGFSVVEPEEGSIPWREAFPEYADKDLPGVSLRGARGREELTQAALSKLTGIPQRHISEMENGKRPIGKKNAKTLAKALRTSYKVFL